jgi:hypothetical protein
MDYRTLHEVYKTDPKASQYAFSEVKTPNYMMFIDIDIKEKNDIVVDNDKLLEHTLRIACKIINNINYIVCTKNDESGGYHIYFPEIIINNEIGLLFHKRLIDQLAQTDLALSADKIDKSVYKGTGIRPLFVEYNGSHYKIDGVLSAYMIPDDKIEQLGLTSIHINKY